MDKTKSRVQGKSLPQQAFPRSVLPTGVGGFSSSELQHELLGATSEQERGEAPDPSTASAGSFLEL